jgi:hypothetical protein
MFRPKKSRPNLLHMTGLNQRPAFALILMPEEPKTASEIARLIKDRANYSLGPWPMDFQLFIFGTTSGWKCGLSPARQAAISSIARRCCSADTAEVVAEE